MLPERLVLLLQHDLITFSHSTPSRLIHVDDTVCIMASTEPKGPSEPQTATIAPDTKLALSPIQTNTDNIASIYKYIHPLLVSTIFYSRFNAIVLDSVGALLSLLPVIAILQCIYCAICLPTSSSNATEPQSTTQSAKAATKQHKSGQRKGATAGKHASTDYTSRILVRLPPSLAFVLMQCPAIY